MNYIDYASLFSLHLYYIQLLYFYLTKERWGSLILCKIRKLADDSTYEWTEWHQQSITHLLIERMIGIISTTRENKDNELTAWNSICYWLNGGGYEDNTIHPYSVFFWILLYESLKYFECMKFTEVCFVWMHFLSYRSLLHYFYCWFSK